MPRFLAAQHRSDVTLFTLNSTMAMLAVAMPSGCASVFARESLPSRGRIIDVPVGRAREAARRALQECRYAVAVSSTTAALIGERPERPEQMARLVREPLGRLGDAWWSLQVTLIVTLTEFSPTQTRVTVRSRLMGRTTAMRQAIRESGLTVVPLTSNGTLEREYQDAIDAAHSTAAGGRSSSSHNEPADVEAG